MFYVYCFNDTFCSNLVIIEGEKMEFLQEVTVFWFIPVETEEVLSVLYESGDLFDGYSGDTFIKTYRKIFEHLVKGELISDRILS